MMMTETGILMMENIDFEKIICIIIIIVVNVIIKL